MVVRWLGPIVDRSMLVRWLGPIVALALPASAAAQDRPQQSPQVVFESLLLGDRSTTEAIKDLLRRDVAHVSPRPTFADLTGDGRQDAVVAVHTGGAAGAVAVYVLSTDGTRRMRLRPVYRSQALYRARWSIEGGVLTVMTPRYERGDDLCCPAARRERTYRWDDASRRLKLRRTKIVRRPGG
jgi:hypothetical protein